MKTDPVKVLLVDDTEQNLVALQGILRRDGLELLPARSGKEALELLLQHDFALALLDVQMPEMDGFELAELMRGVDRSRHVPIIFVTAGAKDPHRSFKGYESGAVDFLFKPLEPHVLKGKTDVFIELYRQRRELANALRLNELFVGILGHDLRNPLGALMISAQLLDVGPATDEQRDLVQRILSSGKRMSGMIEQLLDLTRARLTDGLGFVRTRVELDVTLLVQRALEEFRSLHRDSASSVVTEFAGPTTLAGDTDRMLQLFSNLLSNAATHGTQGSPIEVSVKGTLSEVLVAVKNAGTIPEDLLPFIFDPFRGREGMSGASPGLGLGLFISQQIAIAHGGRVDVDSDAAHRTTCFTVVIPKVIAEPLSEGSPLST